MKTPSLFACALALTTLAIASHAVGEEQRSSFVFPVYPDSGRSKPAEPPKPVVPPKPMTRIEQPMAPGVAEALAKEGKKTYTYQKFMRFEGQGATRLQAVKIANRERLEAERALVTAPVLSWKTISYAVVSCKPGEGAASAETYCGFGVVYELTSTEPAPAAGQAPSSNAAADKAQKDAAALAYLQAVMRGTTLAARKCPDGEGKYYVVGKRSKVSPEVVPCVDVHFRVQCAGSNAYIDGVAPTFIGVATDCFMGDTARIDPTPGCPVDQVKVSVVKVTSCGVR